MLSGHPGQLPADVSRGCVGAGWWPEKAGHRLRLGYDNSSQNGAMLCSAANFVSHCLANLLLTAVPPRPAPQTQVWAFGTVLWELCTWRLPFEDLNTFQVGIGFGWALAANPCRSCDCWAGWCLQVLCRAAPATAAHDPPTQPPAQPHPRPTLSSMQIIAKVQSQGSAGLHIPLPEELPAGPLSCYPQYVELMKSCWSVESELRPTFSSIVQQLG